MDVFFEFQRETLVVGLLVVLFSVAPAGTAGAPPESSGVPPREPGWKKYLKYLGWLFLATLLGLVFLYAVGDSSGGDDPPGTSSAPWTPVGLPTELFDCRVGWAAEEWADHLTGTGDQEVYDAIARFVELKSHRVLKPEVVHRLGDILRIPLADRADLPWYVRQRMVETAPAETARAIEVARQSLNDSFGYRDACRHGMASVEKRHGTRLYEFAFEYKQKR